MTLYTRLWKRSRNAQIQIPISRHACLSHGGLHTCPANAVSGVSDLAGGDGMEIIEPKVWSEIPYDIPFYVVLTDDPAVAVARFEKRWGYKPELAYKIEGKFWMAKRSDDARSND